MRMHTESFSRKKLPRLSRDSSKALALVAALARMIRFDRDVFAFAPMAGSIDWH